MIDEDEVIYFGGDVTDVDGRADAANEVSSRAGCVTEAVVLTAQPSSACASQRGGPEGVFDFEDLKACSLLCVEIYFQTPLFTSFSVDLLPSHLSSSSLSSPPPSSKKTRQQKKKKALLSSI